MSQHYDGIPAGVVGEFLERQGFGERKRVANGWLNLRVLFLSRASAPASTRARADKNAQGLAAWSCGQAVPMRRTSCARVRHPRARAFPQARAPARIRGAIPSLLDTFFGRRFVQMPYAAARRASRCVWHARALVSKRPHARGCVPAHSVQGLGFRA